MSDKGSSPDRIDAGQKGRKSLQNLPLIPIFAIALLILGAVIVFSTLVSPSNPSASLVTTETTTPFPTVTISQASPAASLPSETAGPTTTLPAVSQTPVPSETQPLPLTSTALPAMTGTSTSTPDPQTIQETFNGSFNEWQVLLEISGSGGVVRTSDLYVEGMASARLDLTGQGGSSFIKSNFRDAALEHTWGERPGTWNWFRAYVYVPSASLAQLASDGYVTLGGIYASQTGYGWYLRVHQNGALYVVGSRDWDSLPVEFNVYGSLPQDRWVQLELGLHSQAGPGVKRAFAFLLDGDFYGWYHQGEMKEEVYDTAAVGIISTNTSQPLTMYVDDWFKATQDSFPSGSDNRSSADVQEQDFTSQDGRMWQIDWTTWSNDLVLDPQFGLYSASSRFQSGRNLDRMPSLESGWAEIEFDWPQGPPPADESTADMLDGLVAFRKEVNREENLETGFYVNNGQAVVYYCAWVGNCVDFGEWTVPQAQTLSDGRNLPEPGDVVRVRWEQVSDTEIHVQTSFYDASADKWYANVIDDTRDLTNLPDQDPEGDTVNFLDGYHLASAITADSPYYSIRRYRVGTLETYPTP
jgi:hypothetical protein